MSQLKYIIISRRTIAVTLAVICAVVFSVVAVSSAGGFISVATANKKLPIYSTKYDKNVASLSFDAAWGNEDTGQLIEILDKYKVKATFFIVGEWVDKYPDSVKALSDAGHEIMNHSNTHPDMSKLSREQMLEEIKGCNQKIKKITGKEPTLFRAPYGAYNNTLIEVLSSINMHCVQWDVDSLDWKNYSSNEISARVIRKVGPGSITLFHNAAPNTPAALPTIIEKLQADGFKLIPISKLIYKDNFTLDHEGRQIPNQTTATQTTKSAKSAPTTKKK